MSPPTTKSQCNAIYTGIWNDKNEYCELSLGHKGKHRRTFEWA